MLCESVDDCLRGCPYLFAHLTRLVITLLLMAVRNDGIVRTALGCPNERKEPSVEWSLDRGQQPLDRHALELATDETGRRPSFRGLEHNRIVVRARRSADHRPTISKSLRGVRG